MRRLLVLAGAMLACGPVSADEPGLEWKHDGHFRLAEAAAEAKRTGKRLLLGLAGSPG